MLRVRMFFSEAYNVPEKVLDEYEPLFYFLVFKKDPKVNGHPANSMVKLAIEVFGAKPSICNCKKFFNHEAIRGLWIGQWGGCANAYLNTIRTSILKAIGDKYEKKQYNDFVDKMEKSLDFEWF